MFGQYMHFTRFAPKRNDYSLDRCRTQVRRILETLEQRLGVVPFLGGQSYSIADIATFPWARGVGTFLGKPGGVTRRSLAPTLSCGAVLEARCPLLVTSAAKD